MGILFFWTYVLGTSVGQRGIGEFGSFWLDSHLFVSFFFFLFFFFFFASIGREDGKKGLICM